MQGMLDELSEGGETEAAPEGEVGAFVGGELCGKATGVTGKGTDVVSEGGR